jgi:SWI/SNF-related matrix-associated actin-dependent regulator 1 of chromatin subfamily A
MSEAKVAKKTLLGSPKYTNNKSAQPKLSSDLRRNVELSHAPDISFSAPNFNGTLYSYQKSSVAYCIKNERVIVAEPTGTGKTVIACGVMCSVNATPAIIVCPKSLVPVWEQEVQKFAGQVVDSVQVVDSASDEITGEDVTVLSYGMLSYDLSDNGGSIVKQLCEIEAEAFIADEAHALRGDSLRSQAAEQVASNVQYRLLMTGTPIVRDEEDVDRLLDILDQNISLPDRHRFLNRKLRAYCYVRHPRQVVLTSLPDRVRKPVRVDISNRREYEEKKSRFDHHELSKRAGFKALYEFRKTAAMGKIDYVTSLARDVNGPVALFAIHQNVQRELLKRFDNSLRVTADLSTKQRQRQVERFQDGDADVIVCAMGNSPEQSPGGVGIELTRASHAIFAELGWTHSHMVQAANRVHRLGQQDPVRLWFPIARDTIDEKIWELIEERKAVTNKAANGKLTIPEILTEIY